MSKHRLFQRALKTLGVGVGVFVLAVGSVFSQGLCLNGMSENCGCGAGLSVCDDDGVSSIFDDAVSVWAFNDPADLGADSVGSNDLTLVNVPTATGGALGYVADFDSASDQQANMATDASINTANMYVAAWIRLEAETEAFHTVVEREGDFLTTCRWYLTTVAADNTVVFIADDDGDGDCTGDIAATTTDTYTVGARHFFEGYGTTASGSGVAIDRGTDVTGANVSFSATPSLYVSSGITTADWNGVVGPVMLYSDLPSTAVRDSLHNSGKGKVCADLTAAEQVNLVSCWDMDEDGGPYTDSIGSNDLTAVNAPTQGVGLVERSDSGMSVSFEVASTQYMWIADNAELSHGDRDFSYVFWAFRDNNTGAQNLISKSSAGQREWRILNNNAADRVYVAGSTDCSAEDIQLNAGVGSFPANEWIMVYVYHDAGGNLVGINVNDGDIADVSAAETDGVCDGTARFQIAAQNDVPAVYYDNWIDNAARFNQLVSAADLTTLYNAGAGTFYAAFMDAIFHGPRFAWSKKPEQRRITWQ